MVPFHSARRRTLTGLDGRDAQVPVPSTATRWRHCGHSTASPAAPAGGGWEESIKDLSGGARVYDFPAAVTTKQLIGEKQSHA